MKFGLRSLRGQKKIKKIGEISKITLPIAAPATTLTIEKKALAAAVPTVQLFAARFCRPVKDKNKLFYSILLVF